MKTIMLLLAACSVVGYVLTSCNTIDSKPLTKNYVTDNIQLVKRGEYLVNTIGRDDCHSPKKMGANGPEIDMTLRFSGYPAQRAWPPVDEETVQNGWTLFGSDLTSAIGPWGATFAANITSDETGIGT